MRYESIPHTVDAIEFDGKNHSTIYDWVQLLVSEPPLMSENMRAFHVMSKEGMRVAHPGDFIAIARDGDVFTVKKEAFQRGYKEAQKPTKKEVKK